MHLRYSKNNQLMNEFVEKSEISRMEYEPHLLGANPIIQSIIFLIKESFVNTFMPDRFSRETVKLPDGGTMGLDWDGPIPTEENPLTQPLIIVAPGLNGNAYNLYSLALIWKARLMGYKIVTVLFRGAGGMPLTSGKLSFIGCWKDWKFMLEYTINKYNRDRNGKKRVKVFAYGISLGANVLSLYLGKVGKDALNYIDCAALYASPWSLYHGHRVFWENYKGYSNYVIGHKLNADIKSEHLPQLKQFISKEDYDRYEYALNNNPTGLDHIDREIFTPMFGYRDLMDMYKDISIDLYVGNTAVPTFSLDADDDILTDGKWVPYKEIEKDSSNMI